jgi:ribosomal protein S14
MKHKKYIKNIKQRQLYKKTELFQKILKVLFIYIKNKNLQLVIQKIFFFKLFKSCFKSVIKNFCLFTGRSRGVYKKFKICRIFFKKLSERGLFFGIQKLS